MESYRPTTVFSSIDRGGRYAYGNQPFIARWNLARFAETLLPLIDEESTDEAAAKAMEILNDFIPTYERLWLAGARAKLGFSDELDDENEDKALVEDWHELLEQHSVDFTLAWRRLADAADGNATTLQSLFPSEDVLQSWLGRWEKRISEQTVKPAEAMRAINPLYIPRNQLVEQALTAASDHADLGSFEKLLEVITDPFNERPGLEEFTKPAPNEFTACYKTFCGT